MYSHLKIKGQHKKESVPLARPFPLYLNQKSAKKFQIFPFILIEMRKKKTPFKTSNIYLGKESYFQYSSSASATAESPHGKGLSWLHLGQGNDSAARFHSSFAVGRPTPAPVRGTPAGWWGAAANASAKNTMRGTGRKLDCVLLMLWAKRTWPGSRLGAKQSRSARRRAPAQTPASLLALGALPARPNKASAPNRKPNKPFNRCPQPRGEICCDFTLGCVWEFGKAASGFTWWEQSCPVPHRHATESPVPPELLPPPGAAAWKPILKKS